MNKKQTSIIICMVLLVTAISAAGTTDFIKDNNTTETYTNTNEITKNQKELNFDKNKESNPLPAPLVVDNWPMYRHDPAHTGYSTSNAPDTNSTLWEFQTSTGWNVITSPAIVDDKVFFSTEHGRELYCLDVKTGDKLWEAQYSSYVKSALTVTDEKIYFSTVNSIICAYATNGTEKWSFPIDYYSTKSSPTVIDGKVYIGSGIHNTTMTYHGIFYCLDAQTGVELWNFTIPDGLIFSSSAAFADEKIYFGADDNKIYCLNTNGTEAWNYTTGGSCKDSSPVIYKGKVYIGSDDHKLYCLNASNGQKIWSKTISGTPGPPAVFDDRLYLGSNWRKVYCLNANNGAQIWMKWLPDGTNGVNDPVVADGKLYVGANSLNFYCLNIINGAIIWRFQTDGYTYKSPSIADGKVFMGTSYGTLYCFRDNHEPITPNQPSGPTEGGLGFEYTFFTNTTEPDNDYLYYLFDWGDGTNSSWIGPYLSGENVSANHTWEEEEDFEIKVKAKDHLDLETSWSTIHIINISNRPPELPTIPVGPLSFEIGKICFYGTSADDPDGHKVRYRFDWDDKTYSEWSSLVVPGQTINLSHSWISPGTYMVKAQAMDEYNLTTEWSEGLPVVVSAGDWWPWWSMFRHDPLNAGSSPSKGPDSNNVTWTSPLIGDVQSSSPAVVDDRVYVTFDAEEPGIYCFNATNGEEIWINHTDAFGRSPAVVNGRVFVGAGETMYCWDAHTGDELWKNTTNGGIYVSPVVVDDKVYVASWFGEVYCFNVIDGTKIWSKNVGYGVHFTMSSPAIADGRLFIGSTEGMNGNLYCFNASNGQVLWTFPAGHDVKSSPAFAYGNVYFGADNGMVYCLDVVTGLKKWSFETSKDFYVRSSPAISDGYVYIGSANHKIYCINAFNGTEKWAYDTGTSVYSSPLIADGNVYIGHLASSDNNIRCFNASDGSEIWTYSTGAGTWSSPAIAQGKLYIGESGKIYCFGSNLPPETPDPPLGPDEGVVDEEYTFCVELPIDTNGEPFSVLWDWGDGNISGWMGPYSSGETACASHTWTNIGNYEIRVKIEDTYGVQSSWTDPFLIHIIEPAFIELRDIKGGFGLTVIVKNIGGAPATDLRLTVTVVDGLFVYNRNIIHAVGNIDGGESIKVPIQMFGIGLGILTDIPTITLTADSVDTDTTEESISAMIIGPIVILQ